MIEKKYVSEIRFIPRPDFLDMMGKMANALVNSSFTNWKISQNRVEVTNKDSLFFVTYSSLGFVTVKKDEMKDCMERLSIALNILGDLPPTRWGVRIYTIASSNKQFPKLLDEYKKELLNFKPSDFSKIGGELKDVGVSYVFQRDAQKYHIQTGPMEKEQAKDFFPDAKLTKRGIFVDLDIYKDSFFVDDKRKRKIENFINDSFIEGEKVIDQFLDTIKQ